MIKRQKTRQTKKISPQPITKRKSVSDPNIKSAKKDQARRKTLNSSEPVLMTRSKVRFTTTPESKSAKSKRSVPE